MLTALARTFVLQLRHSYRQISAEEYDEAVRRALAWPRPCSMQ